jgi:hypothetical protein
MIGVNLNTRSKVSGLVFDGCLRNIELCSKARSPSGGEFYGRIGLQR